MAGSGEVINLHVEGVFIAGKRIEKCSVEVDIAGVFPTLHVSLVIFANVEVYLLELISAYEALLHLVQFKVLGPEVLKDPGSAVDEFLKE